MRFYDTLSRSVREFTPHDGGRVAMYTCGPTVYRPVHIGNLRTFLAADLLRRALELEGLSVRVVTNITDVGHMTDDTQEADGEAGGEDKMQLAAEDEGLTAAEIAAKYTEAFHRDREAVNILPAAVYPKATDHIPEMVELTERLLVRGHAYEAEGMVYFDVDTFPAYGRLSHNDVQRLAAGHRSENVDPRKRHHYDFTLWRAAGPRRRVRWPSPWGDGFPGWHIECSAMSLRHLGEQVDVHTGGADLVFPHHEDEIAQSEGAVGHPVVAAWSHAYHLLAEGRKMSKSAGNFYGLDDLVERGADPLAFRYLMLQTCYREPTNFTWEALDAAGRGLERHRRQVASWFAGAGPNPGASGLPSVEAADLDERFRAAVADDLNTPRALAVLADVGAAPIPDGDRYRLVSAWDRFLGLDLDRAVVAHRVLPPGAAERLEARDRARADRDWASADRIRAELAVLAWRSSTRPREPAGTDARTAYRASSGRSRPM